MKPAHVSRSRLPKVPIPRGWRKLKGGTTIRPKDRWACYFAGKLAWAETSVKNGSLWVGWDAGNCNPVIYIRKSRVAAKGRR